MRSAVVPAIEDWKAGVARRIERLPWRWRARLRAVWKPGLCAAESPKAHSLWLLEGDGRLGFWADKPTGFRCLVSFFFPFLFFTQQLDFLLSLLL